MRRRRSARARTGQRRSRSDARARPPGPGHPSPGPGAVPPARRPRQRDGARLRSGRPASARRQGLIAMSIGSGRIMTRTGRYKVFPTVGLIVVAVGLGLFSLLGVDTPLPVAGGYMLVLGAGLGMVMQVHRAEECGRRCRRAEVTMLGRGARGRRLRRAALGPVGPIHPRGTGRSPRVCREARRCLYGPRRRQTASPSVTICSSPLTEVRSLVLAVQNAVAPVRGATARLIAALPGPVRASPSRCSASSTRFSAASPTVSPTSTRSPRRRARDGEGSVRMHPYLIQCDRRRCTANRAMPAPVAHLQLQLQPRAAGRIGSLASSSLRRSGRPSQPLESRRPGP